MLSSLRGAQLHYHCEQSEAIFHLKLQLKKIATSLRPSQWCFNNNLNDYNTIAYIFWHDK